MEAMDESTHEGAEGQVETAPEGTTVEAPATQTEQAEAEDTFFDVNALDPSLMPAYKQMQGAFTKKMQSLSEMKGSLAEYQPLIDSFNKDPMGTLAKLNAQYGYKPEPQTVDEGDKTPETWDDVFSTAEQRAEARIMQKLAPVLNQFQAMQSKSVETTLDSIDPMWREHEDTMMSNLKAYPQMANDLEKLYRLSVPQEVFEKRAYAKAMAKLKGQTANANVSTKGSTTKSTPAMPKASTFAEAVENAREMLKQGRGAG